MYDALLAVAPPAALTPEGVAQGHELAAELATDMRSRRKRSVAALLGRLQLNPEQADMLLAGEYPQNRASYAAKLISGAWLPPKFHLMDCIARLRWGWGRAAKPYIAVLCPAHALAWSFYKSMHIMCTTYHCQIPVCLNVYMFLCFY